eukprot:TRINITY_DN42195_c0_g1_i1.p1 TRINITY_DN42195_c0_g1~~TRINITY_DN42195_c0_g1_i1.p1  ORF type:complete len:322 (+),score=6.93 TRINITY_DN42195_c0_g1_i1:91-966(+)
MAGVHPPPPLHPATAHQPQTPTTHHHHQIQPNDILTYTGSIGYTSTPKDVRESANSTPVVKPRNMNPPAKRRSVSAGAPPQQRPPRARPSPGTFCQEQPSKNYNKFNYGLKRDVPPQTNIYSTPMKREQQTPQRASSPANRVPDADGAWERLVQLAKDDFSAEELAMLYWDTLSKLLQFYHIEEPMEVARIELTWKEIQAARSAAAGEPQPHHQPPQVPPITISQKGCRDHGAKHSYTPYTYTIVRDPPSVTRNTRSGTPVVTPQQECDAKRSSSLGRTLRSVSPAQRPWM